MKPEQVISIDQMKHYLILAAGAQHPVKITKRDDQVIVGFIRGFADQQTNIALFSETAETHALKVFEVKDICTLQIMDDDNRPLVLKAKWFKKIAKF
jgi:hypothetical protein